MNRRRFLRLSGSGLAVAAGGLAGCLGNDDGGDTPPPRDAEVFDDVSIADGRMEIDLVSSPTVESRVDNVDAAAIGSLLPVGTARAGSRSSSSSSGSGSSGATGRGSGGYSSAPTGRHGWVIYGGHTHSSGWRDDHDDDLETYRAGIAALGVAYMGSNTDYRQASPGPGPVDWDEKWTDLEPGSTLAVDLATLSSDSDTESGGDSTAASENESDTDSDPEAAAENVSDADIDAASTAQNASDTDAGEPESASEIDASANEGWYRVGTHLESPDGDIDFDWQAADFKLERGTDGALTVDEAWHVRPRL